MVDAFSVPFILSWYSLINPYSLTLAQNIQALAEVAGCRGCLVTVGTKHANLLRSPVLG